MPLLTIEEVETLTKEVKLEKPASISTCPECGSVNCDRVKRSSIEKLLSNATLGFYGTRKFRCFNCLEVFFK